MAHYHVDGTLVVAKLRRNIIGGGAYQAVMIRQEDGSHRRINTLTVLDDIMALMVPGTLGRFYFYDVLGFKGVYGARPIGAKARACFPYRWDVIFAGLGALNLLVALGWWLLHGSFAPFAATLGLLCLAVEALFILTRVSGMKSYRADDPRVPSAAEVQAVPARG